jgi:hypothetical protein
VSRWSTTRWPCWRRSPTPGLDPEQGEAVALLTLVAGQDVEAGERSWRVPGGSRQTGISTVDPEARHTHNSGAAKRDGYKGHLPAKPETGLVTGVYADRRHHRGRPDRGRVAGR